MPRRGKLSISLTYSVGYIRRMHISEPKVRVLKKHINRTHLFYIVLALMQYMTVFSTASKRLNINNTVQAKRSAVARDTLYQRLGETRH